MKKATITIFLIILLSGSLYGVYFYWQNLRGIGPVFKSPKEKITEIIPPTPAPDKPTPAINSTGFPLSLPNNFQISIFAQNLTAPRDLTTDPEGNLLVSIPKKGQILAIAAPNKQTPLLSNLNNPHGLFLNCQTPSACDLYVAETTKLTRYDYDPTNPKATNPTHIIDLPSGGRHTTRTLALHPDGKHLLISIGSACDVCQEPDSRHGTIQSIDLTSKPPTLQPYATGLRNSVFITRRPNTDQIWSTEMGRDRLGDNLPPDEINIIEESQDYGWPICYGQNIHDTQFDKNTYIRNPCDDKTPAFIDLPAHVAPLGLAFISQDSTWPEEYRGNLLVAYHGSWNSSIPVGYKIARFKNLDSPQPTPASDFISGWLTSDKSASLGRPADLEFRDNSLYISDDKAGVIYLVEYKG